MTRLDDDAFLKQEIASSSPARLRFLLIRKAVGLCRIVENLWQNGNFAQADQWTLRIQEILTELLDGIQDPRNPLAASVSDLYVYVLKLFFASTQNRDADGLRAVREILEIDQETWSMYVDNEHRAGGSSPSDEDSEAAFDISM